MWMPTDHSSFLIEITADILNYVDEHGTSTVDVILDAAGQKVDPTMSRYYTDTNLSTGNWQVDSDQRSRPWPARDTHW